MASAQEGVRPAITYGPTRGRAEPIRLILEELGIDYEERHITSLMQWLALKPQMPFLQTPSYQEGDVFIVQSHAIYRHLARTHELYGHTEQDHIDCDIVEEAIHDAHHRFWWFLNGLLPARDQAGYMDIELAITLGCLERFLGRRSSDAQFWVGDSLTFVDLLAFSYLDDVRALFPGALEKFPRLDDFRNRIAARPRIAAYLKSERRPSAILFGPDGQPVVDPLSTNPPPDPFWTP